MSIYSTQYIDRERAEELVQKCRLKNDRSLAALTNEELDSELHTYVYSGKYDDILGFGYNFIIVKDSNGNAA